MYTTDKNFLIPVISRKIKWAAVNDTQSQKLCFTQFSTRIYWNRILAVSALFRTFTQWIKVRSSRSEVFCKKGVRKSVTSFTGKHLCRSFFFNKGLRPAIKKRLWYRWFPVKFGNFLRRDFLQNTSGGCFYEFFTFHCHVLIKNIWKR